MPGTTMSQSKTAGQNSHGISPPEGCIIWGIYGEALQVATGRLRKAPFERSLLIDSEHFDRLVAELVCQSDTLKALFAYRVSTRVLEAGQEDWLEVEVERKSASSRPRFPSCCVG
jgi:hypothetical protein